MFLKLNSECVIPINMKDKLLDSDNWYILSVRMMYHVNLFLL